MSKLLANQISNYNDNGPVEVKDGVNIPTGKPLQVAGANGTSGQYLTSTGSSIAWTTFPTIPAAQVQTDWNATVGIASILNKPTLATVATSGSYNDLINKPTIPAAQIQSDWSQTNSVALDFIKNKPTLFSGSWNDLTDKPSLFSGSWNDLTDKPTLFSGSWNDLTDKPTLVTTLNGLSDVDTSGVSTNKILKYNGTSWVVADDLSGGGADGNTTYTQAVVSDSSNVKLRLSGSDSTDDDILITAGNNISFSNVSTEGFTLSASATSGANVTTSDSAPSSPNDGDLWWKSNEGRLKVYYEDADSSQWVDASPPLAATGGATVTTSDSAPSSPSDGDLWWKSDEGRLKVYYQDADSIQWVDASPIETPTNITQTTTNGTNALTVTTSTSGFNANAIEIRTDNNSASAVRWRFTPPGQFIPFANAAYDIGNAEYKVRHMFLSDNTVYFEGDFLKVAQHNSGGSAQSPSYLIPLAKLKDALNASADYEAFKTAILAITDA